MLRNLTKIANKLDTLGLTKEADLLDSIIQKMGQQYFMGKKIDGGNASNFKASTPKQIMDFKSYFNGLIKSTGLYPNHINVLDAIGDPKWTVTTDYNLNKWAEFAGYPPNSIGDWKAFATQYGYAPNIQGVIAFINDTKEDVISFIESSKAPTTPANKAPSVTLPSNKITEAPASVGHRPSTGPTKDVGWRDSGYESAGSTGFHTEEALRKAEPERTKMYSKGDIQNVLDSRGIKDDLILDDEKKPMYISDMILKENEGAPIQGTDDKIISIYKDIMSRRGAWHSTP